MLNNIFSTTPIESQSPLISLILDKIIMILILLPLKNFTVIKYIILQYLNVISQKQI